MFGKGCSDCSVDDKAGSKDWRQERFPGRSVAGFQGKDDEANPGQWKQTDAQGAQSTDDYRSKDGFMDVSPVQRCGRESAIELPLSTAQRLEWCRGLNCVPPKRYVVKS